MPGKLSLMSEKCKSHKLPELYDENCEVDVNSDTAEEDDCGKMNESELKSTWFKSWTDNDYDKLDQTPRELSLEEDHSLASQIKHANSHIPLNKLLDNIPLAYSPITKQLHVLNPKDQSKNLVKNVYQSLSKNEVDENGDDDCHNSKETKPPHINKNVNKSTCTTDTDDQIYEEKLCKLWNSKIDYSEPEFRKEDQAKGEQVAIRTETSSFSSIVSSLSDNSPLNQDDSTSDKLSTRDNDDLSVRSVCSHDSGSTCGENSKFFECNTNAGKDGKRRGLSGFFSRNVFAWKPTNSIGSQGWKIFGKNNTQENHSGCSGSESRSSASDSPVESTKKYEDVVVSSSALILHNRPPNLPAKSLDEQQKHKMEYAQIVEAARRKEVKESKKREKQLQQQLKFEDQLTNASKIWSCEILPKWDLMKNTRKTMSLWWAGIPPSVRGKIWKLAIGNELNITYQLYEICAARAQERLKNMEVNSDHSNDACNKESSVELIQLDISRTFPQLCIFQKGGPYYDILHCLLGAYVCYRPDVGYVQGMSFIAAVLILNLEPADAFICFANLLNRPCHLAFFTLNQSFMHAYYNTYNGLFKENLPKLCQHFQEASLTPDLYLLDWVYSVFAKALPLDIACRIWDVFLRDGEEFIFRAALGILHLHQEKLLKLDFINGAQFLLKLPEDLSADLLFKSIGSIKMCIGKVKFGQVLTKFIEKCSPR